MNRKPMSFEKTGPVPQETTSLGREAQVLAERARLAHEQAEAALKHAYVPQGLTPRDLAAMRRARQEIVAADRALFERVYSIRHHMLAAALSCVVGVYLPMKTRLDNGGIVPRGTTTVGRQEEIEDKAEMGVVNLEKEKVYQAEQKRLASRLVADLTQSNREADVPRSRDELRERILRLARSTPVAAAIVELDQRQFIDYVQRGIADHARQLAAQGLVTQALRWQQCAPEHLPKMDLYAVGHRPEAAINHLLEIVENPRLESSALAVTRLADEIEGHETFIEELSQAIDRRARLERHDRARMVYLRELLGQALQQRERDIIQDARLESGARAKSYAMQLDRVHQAEADLNVSPVGDLALGK